MNTDNRVEYTEKTPLEDLRQSALKHYEEASSAIHHWSSFVEAAIKAYNPEWQKQQPLGLRDEEIKQEFKELSIYLDDIYFQHVNNTKDAGHLWIAFTDKFNAFKKKLLSLPAPVEGEEHKSFSEWVNSYNETDPLAVAGDGYDGLSQLSKFCIDAAVRKYLTYISLPSKK